MALKLLISSRKNNKLKNNVPSAENLYHFLFAPSLKTRDPVTICAARPTGFFFLRDGDAVIQETDWSEGGVLVVPLDQARFVLMYSDKKGTPFMILKSPMLSHTAPNPASQYRCLKQQHRKQRLCTEM